MTCQLCLRQVLYFPVATLLPKPSIMRSCCSNCLCSDGFLLNFKFFLLELFLLSISHLTLLNWEALILSFFFLLVLQFKLLYSVFCFKERLKRFTTKLPNRLTTHTSDHSKRRSLVRSRFYPLCVQLLH